MKVIQIIHMYCKVRLRKSISTELPGHTSHTVPVTVLMRCCIARFRRHLTLKVWSQVQFPVMKKHLGKFPYTHAASVQIAIKVDSVHVLAECCHKLGIMY